VGFGSCYSSITTPRRHRRSVEALLELPFTRLIDLDLDHGAAIADGKAAVSALLASDNSSG
jgi:hypothetical protein